jgi:two-component SAPR family response regulator
LIQSHAKPEIEFIIALKEIIERGPFLSQTEYKWLDNIKSEVSNAVVDNCLAFINTYGITKDPEFIIDITNYIFNFDPLNEDALAWKCKSLILLRRHTLANNYYQTFVRDYKEIYGEDYGKSLHDLIA